jgi:hypothetical protein
MTSGSRTRGFTVKVRSLAGSRKNPTWISSVAEHFELLADAEELKRKRNARVALAEHWQESGEDVQLGGGQVSDHELPDLTTCRPARNLCRTFRLGER